MKFKITITSDGNDDTNNLLTQAAILFGWQSQVNDGSGNQIDNPETYLEFLEANLGQYIINNAKIEEQQNVISQAGSVVDKENANIEVDTDATPVSDNQVSN